MGLKPDDRRTVPLCHKCHMELHAYGDEEIFWAIMGIEPEDWISENQ